MNSKTAQKRTFKNVVTILAPIYPEELVVAVTLRIKFIVTTDLI